MVFLYRLETAIPAESSRLQENENKLISHAGNRVIAIAYRGPADDGLSSVRVEGGVYRGLSGGR
jgi:hypothetical protein